MYEQDFNILDAMKSICRLVETIIKNVSTGDRLSSTSQQDEFAVVSLPGNLHTIVHGGGFGNIKTYCDIEIYVRLRKSGHENLTRMDELLKSTLALFPYSDEYISVMNPSVKLKGLDGLGFSATLVRAELVIK